jgi:hypothetical protein
MKIISTKRLSMTLAIAAIGMSNIAIAAEVNCEAAVKNGISLMKAEMEKKNPGKSNMFLKSMSSPKSIKRGIARCELEIKDPKEKKVWACQEKAKSVAALKACE